MDIIISIIIIILLTLQIWQSLHVFDTIIDFAIHLLKWIGLYYIQWESHLAIYLNIKLYGKEPICHEVMPSFSELC